MLFKSDTTRRRITLVAGLIFAIGMGQSLISMFMAAAPTENSAQAAVESASVEQADLVKGYTIVLEREPNNQTALNGLVEIHMRQGNWEGMITPLEKLLALNPSNEGYAALLETAQTELARQTAPPIQPSNPE